MKTTEPKGSSELDELFEDYGVTEWHPTTIANFKRAIEAHAHSLLKSKLSELLEKKEWYLTASWFTYDDGHVEVDKAYGEEQAVPISEIQQLLEQLEGDGND